MIISVEEIMKNPEFKGQDENMMKMRLDALELMIRKYTNNNFQNRSVRFLASSTLSSDGCYLNNVSSFLAVGDTVQVTESEVNDGLYVVEEIDADEKRIKVDKHLYAVKKNLVTKVEYPEDIKMGVYNLMKWEVNNREKVGIKSESLSRHSVTYYDQDVNNQVMGYPVSLLGFLDPYKKARF